MQVKFLYFSKFDKISMVGYDKFFMYITMITKTIIQLANKNEI